MSQLKTESYVFQSDINQLMSLIINSFYQNKDVCFRELISNASDANDKHRHNVLAAGSSLDMSSLDIKVIPDKVRKTLSIIDSGIGMSKDDLITCLGTIAKSGTKEFVQSVMQKKGTNQESKLDQIGQFGVGFYSAYLIADKVTVVTKKDGHGSYMWESDASGGFTITPLEGNEAYSTKRGTQVILHLKTDQESFLDPKFLEDLIKKHSEFVSFPIFLMVEKEVEVDAVDDKEGDVEQVEEDNDKKKHTKKVSELEHVNKQRPIWTLPPQDVTDEQYKDLYRSLTQDWNEPISHKHFSVEGSVDMKAILYLPKHSQVDMHEAMNNPRNINLYVKKVFITNDARQILPSYLSFVRGIVDCEDLPLNISREFLQSNKVIQSVRKNLVKKTIEMMQELAEGRPQDYITFYNEFSKYIKHGVFEDNANREKLEALLRFRSTRSIDSDNDEWRTLDSYVQDMKPEQTGIFYMSGESEDALRASPLLEHLTKDKKCEVLLMTESIDEYAMQRMTEFRGKKFVCVTKNVDLFEESEEVKKNKQDMKKEYEGFCEFVKKSLESQDNVTKVEVSDRVSKNEPCVVTSDAFGITANVERLLKAQSPARDGYFAQMSRKNLLINPHHSLIKELYKQYETDSSKVNTDLIKMVYSSSMLASGYPVPRPREFTQRVYRIVQAGLGLGSDEDENSEMVEDLNVSEAMSTQCKLEEVD